MFLLAISETSVGLSLSIYRWKAFLEQNINLYVEIFQEYFVVVKSQENEKCALLSQVT